MKPNIELARAIQEQIRKEPRQLAMDYYFTFDPEHIPNCGTAACIGGWAITLAGKFKNPEQARHLGGVSSPFDMAMRSLNILPDQAKKLFYTDKWPEDLQNMPEWEGAIKVLDMLINGEI